MATKLLTSRPTEPAVDGSIVRFKHFTGYSYAAIRIDSMWFITQGKLARIPPKSWDVLLDWLEPNNWESLELMS